MPYDIIDRVKTDVSETDVLMTVLSSTWRILAVIDMEDRNLILSDDAVKFIYYIIKMINDIVPAVARMTGVKTYP